MARLSPIEWSVGDISIPFEDHEDGLSRARQKKQCKHEPFQGWLLSNGFNYLVED